MEAVVLDRIGSLKYLLSKQINPPTTKKEEVKIKVKYSGVNHLDLLIIEGKRPTSGKFPLILGSEIVGTRTDTLQKVAVYPWIFCGKCRECKMDCENMCEKGGTIGRTRDGGYAEYICVPEKNLFNIPDIISEKLICAAALSATTAIHMIIRSRIPDRTRVLVNGATGGVGTSLIRLLKYKHASIIATTSHLEKREKLKKIGAEIVIETANMANILKKYFPMGIPFIFDCMGGNVWSESVKLLAKNGTITFCATTLDKKGQVDIGQAFSRQLNILGSYGGTVRDFKEVIELVASGKVKPVIDTIFDLKDTAKALNRLKKQIPFGKILVKV